MKSRRKQTLEGRLGVATTKAQGALDVFEGLAQQLDEAARTKDEVVQALKDAAKAARKDGK